MKKLGLPVIFNKTYAAIHKRFKHLKQYTTVSSIYIHMSIRTTRQTVSLQSMVLELLNFLHSIVFWPSPDIDPDCMKGTQTYIFA